MIVRASRSPCAELLPSQWLDGVAGAAVPAPRKDNDAVAALREWVGFGVAESAQREKANDRYRDAHGIMMRCTARDVAADQASTKRWWQVWK